MANTVPAPEGTESALNRTTSVNAGGDQGDLSPLTRLVDRMSTMGVSHSCGLFPDGPVTHHHAKVTPITTEGVTFDQAEFEVRCEWGLQRLGALGAISDVIVIVDVLSFTTAIDIATARGGVIFPYPLKGESAADYANSLNAKLASPDRTKGFSLSPASLRGLPAGYRLVLIHTIGLLCLFRGIVRLC